MGEPARRSRWKFPSLPLWFRLSPFDLQQLPTSPKLGQTRVRTGCRGACRGRTRQGGALCEVLVLFYWSVNVTVTMCLFLPVKTMFKRRPQRSSCGMGVSGGGVVGHLHFFFIFFTTVRKFSVSMATFCHFVNLCHFGGCWLGEAVGGLTRNRDTVQLVRGTYLDFFLETKM